MNRDDLVQYVEQDGKTADGGALGFIVLNFEDFRNLGDLRVLRLKLS